MNKRLNLKIYGQVQGVGFRYHAKQAAERLGLTGWVKNGDDGAVAIIVEGFDKNLKQFIGWCYNGNKNAKVEKVDEQWEEAKGEFKNFGIR